MNTKGWIILISTGVITAVTHKIVRRRIDISYYNGYDKGFNAGYGKGYVSGHKKGLDDMEEIYNREHK